MNAPATKKLQGFQTMSEERRREIGSLGGRAAHQTGHAHQFTSEEAREAGRKGAASRKAKRAKKQAG